MIRPAAEHEIDSMVTKTQKELFNNNKNKEREREGDREIEKQKQQQFSIENRRSKRRDSCGKV